MAASPHPFPNFGAIVGAVLTILLYTVSVVVWGVRQEGRITTIEVQKLQFDKRFDVLEETGSKQVRAQIAVLDQRLTELQKSVTPYGVLNLEKRVQEIEVNRAAVVAEVEQRLKKEEETNATQNAKIPVLEQRLIVIEDRGKDVPQLQRRLIQIEVLLDNQRTAGQAQPVASRRTYEDRW